MPWMIHDLIVKSLEREIFLMIGYAFLWVLIFRFAYEVEGLDRDHDYREISPLFPKFQKNQF